MSVGSGALVAIAVPPFLTRMLTPETFGAWSLVLQVAGYVGFFSFGMQTVVARHVSIALGGTGSRDAFVSTAFWVLVAAGCIAIPPAATSTQNAFVSTAFWVLVAAGCIAILVLGLVALRIDLLFPSLSIGLREQAAAATFVVGAALSLSLPVAALSGVFVGLQRNEVPAIALTFTRLLLALAVVVAADRTGDLLWMATAYFVAMLSGSVAQGLLWLRLTEAPNVSLSRVTREAAVALRGECVGLSVWNLSMILIAGLDLVIVGRLDYPMVPYFAVAATLILFLGGAMQAISAAILPVAARLASCGDAAGLRSLVESTSRFTAVIGLLAATPLIVCGHLVLSVWVGADYASKGAGILAVLAISNCIRMCALPYVTAAVAAGLQQRMVVTPLVEGVVNVLASVTLGSVFGAIGVAAGTLVGAVVGVVALLSQHALRPALGGGNVRQYLQNAVWPPIRLLLLPVGAWLLVPGVYRSSVVALSASLVLMFVACWFAGLSRDDRLLARQFLHSRHRAGHDG